MFDLLSKGDDVQYKSHSTQINLVDCYDSVYNSAVMQNNFYFLQQHIKEEDIYRELPQIFVPFSAPQDDPEEEYGFEITPHVTVLYGIKEDKDYFGIREKLKDFGEFEFEIGEVSGFRNDKNPYDVLIIKINSKPLEDLHKLLKENFENNYKFPEYKPHMTLAYVKKGACKELEGRCFWTDKKYICPKIQFSHIDKFFLEIPLK